MILVESGAEMTLVPHVHPEFEKLEHQLSHIPYQPWCTSCVNGKAQTGPHKRTESTIEDSELPEVQCDHLMLKDVAATRGLKVLSMNVSNIWVRHVHRCRHETRSRHVRNNVGSENAEHP